MNEVALDELYKQKGEAVTQIEMWQAKLQNVNQQIIKRVNQSKQEVLGNSKEKPK